MGNAFASCPGCLCSCFASQVNGEVLRQKGQTVELRNPQGAVWWYQQAIDHGSIRGMYDMGICHRKLGKPTEAAKWFERGAASGYPGCFVEIGRCYRDGKGIDRDLPKARQWFQKGATLFKGTPPYGYECQTELDTMHRHGLGDSV